MDINSIQLAAKALSATSGAPAGQPVPDAQAVSQFQTMMTAPATPAPSGTQAQAGAPEQALDLPRVDSAPPDAMAQPLQGGAAAQPANAGEAILQGLDQMRNRINGNWQAISAVGGADGKDMSTTQLLQFQAKTIETTTEISFAGKVISKSEQNLEQLVKMN